jgi:hypothetical protein
MGVNDITLTPCKKLSELIILAVKKNALRRAVFSKSHDKALQKMVITLAVAHGRPALQAEFFHRDNKATHKNFQLTEELPTTLCELIGSFSQVNLLCVGGECEYRESKSGKTVLLGGDKLKKYLSALPDAQSNTLISAGKKEKSYILDGSEPFLRALDVSDENGRVYDRKQAKFRQINRFLELIRDVEDKLPKGEIRICDLCCGKSYLSFAVYHYFANVKKYKVTMTGIDLKSDVIAYCSRVASALKFDGLEFICADIREYKTDELPQLVISLHACDIATDVVLQKAAEWNTDVILSTPCCHHEMNHNINCEALSFITEYSMLRQKLSDAATDALRLCRLEALGYSTAAIELIDPDETPKNIMLRAIRKKNFKIDSKEAKEALERYRAAKAFLCGDGRDDLHF